VLWEVLFVHDVYGCRLLPFCQGTQKFEWRKKDIPLL